MRQLLQAGLVALTLSLGGAALAQDAAAPATAASGEQPAPRDQAFLENAATINQMILQQALLAREHLREGEVYAFAHRLVEDHSALNDELRSVAAELGVDLPEGLRVEQREKVRALALETVDKLPTAYLLSEIDTHRKTIELFAKFAEVGESARVRAFAASALPVLEEHLAAARELLPTLQLDKGS